MKRSKPSTVVGGGEMKRATSSVVSIASSDGASSRRSSRSVKLDPASIGRPAFQSLVVTIVCWFLNTSGLVRIMSVARSLKLGWKGIFSMAYSPPGFVVGSYDSHGMHTLTEASSGAMQSHTKDGIAW